MDREWGCALDRPYLDWLVSELLSAGVSNTKKKAVVLLIDNRFEDTPQIAGSVEQLQMTGLSFDTR